MLDIVFKIGISHRWMRVKDCDPGDRPTVGALYPQHHSHDGARPARGGYKKNWTNKKTVMFDKRSNRERCCRWQLVLERRWRWWSQVEDKDRRRDCEDTRTSGSLPFSSGSRPLSRSTSRGVCLTATINIHPQVLDVNWCS